MVRPLLAAAETIVVSRFELSQSRQALSRVLLSTFAKWNCDRGIGATVHQAKCIILLFLNDFICEVLLSAPTARRQCGRYSDAFLHK